LQPWKIKYTSIDCIFRSGNLTWEGNTMDSYLGQISYFAYTRSFRGWLPCDGRLLPISQNMALYSLLGNTYGGDGHSTFALPDLRGRVVVGVNNPPQPDRISVAHAGESGGGTHVSIPASTNVVTAAPPAEGGDKVTAQAPVAQVATLPPPPYAGLGAFICVEGIYPNFI
jgi:microcystin-dependent protein